MRIAQVAPLWERVPPPAYGGTELVVGLLTEELVKRGHEVTLFASGDSQTQAKLQSIHPCSLRSDSSIKEYAIYDMLQLAHVYERASEFDIIHSHMGCAALPFAGLVKTPTITTLHGIFTPDNEKMFIHARNHPFVSISNDQREPRLKLNYAGTVYNGIDVSTYEFYPQSENNAPYLAFLGRMSPEKGPHLAIQIAKRTGWHLKLAGKIDPIDQEYFDTLVKPHCDGYQIEFLGEANHSQKSVLMGNAVATLFPITWREPFGLVMVESMATGTPVIGLRMGSTPEVIADGISGYLCNNIDECVAALTKVESINREKCRQYVIDNFSAERMADGYEAVYQKVIAERFSQNGKLKNLHVA